MKLRQLTEQIQHIDHDLKHQANNSVNRPLTIRNWMIGYYIFEYEQKGEDRAEYVQTATAQSSDTIVQTATAQFESTDSQLVTPDLKSEELVEISRQVVQRLSFSHITLLLSVQDELARIFYAIEAIKGTWSFRELKRQINSLLYQRAGMSKQPERLFAKLKNHEEQPTALGLVKDIYTFEFLGLPISAAVEESDLETALLDHLEEFLLELGRGYIVRQELKSLVPAE